MKKRLAIAFSTFLAVFAAPSMADGLAEQNYGGVIVGVSQSGDEEIKEALGDMTYVTGMLNFNVAPKIDVGASITYASASTSDYKYTQLSIGGEATYWFMPGEKVNPYVGTGVYFAKIENVERSWWYNETETSNEIGFIVSAGAEFDVAPRLILRAGVTLDACDGEQDVGINAITTFGIAENVYLTLGAGYWTDVGDTEAQAGIIVKF